MIVSDSQDKEDFCYEINDIVTLIRIETFEQLLIQADYDREEILHLKDGFTNGFDLSYRGPLDRQDRSSNLPLKIGLHQEIWDKLLKEVKLKRHAGPFTKIPLKISFNPQLV